MSSMLRKMKRQAFQKESKKAQKDFTKQLNELNRIFQIFLGRKDVTEQEVVEEARIELLPKTIEMLVRDINNYEG